MICQNCLEYADDCICGMIAEETTKMEHEIMALKSALRHCRRYALSQGVTTRNFAIWCGITPTQLSVWTADKVMPPPDFKD